MTTTAAATVDNLQTAAPTYVTSVSQRWLITITIMLVAIIEVLDMTIVNVSLPHMMGALGATSDQITWVLTSYIVSAAIVMPLTGMLVDRLGRKPLLIISIIGFLIASMLCGAAMTLSQIVFFRMLQGIFGAPLVPLSQYVLRDTYPPDKQGDAMAIWGIGIMTAPILGPTLGGYITEISSWRWVFYINIPVCVIAFFMALRYIQDTPIKKIPIDWLGLILMASGIGCLQILLDRGNSSDWFSSNVIIILAIISAICLTTFIIRGFNKANNIVNIRLFTERNFAIATLLITTFCISIFGVMSSLPYMLEHLMNYSTATTGLVMAPIGIVSAIGMQIGTRLMYRFGYRIVVSSAILIMSLATYLMSGYNLNMGITTILIPSLIQGLGMGFFFVPLATFAFAYLPEKYVAQASGLFTFGRSLGSSIGISIISTIVAREAQINWNRLGGHIQQTSGNLQQWLATTHLQLSDPLTIHRLSIELSRQSQMIAFIDAFKAISIAFLCITPLVFLLKAPPAGYKKK